MPVKLHASVRGDEFDTQNFSMQMKHFMSKVPRSEEIPDEVLEPEWEEPHQVQINVVNANELVGDEDQYVKDMEDSNKTLWLDQRTTRGQLPLAPRDEETAKFEDDWQPNDLDNLENLPQLAEKFMTRNGVVDRKDRFGDLFKEDTPEALDYIGLATAENERVIDKIYQTV